MDTFDGKKTSQALAEELNLAATNPDDLIQEAREEKIRTE